MSKFPGATPGVISKRSKMNAINSTSNSNASDSLATVAQPLEDAISSAFEETYAKDPEQYVPRPLSEGAKPLKIPEGLQKQMKLNPESERSMNFILQQKIAKLKLLSICPNITALSGGWEICCTMSKGIHLLTYAQQHL